MARIAFAHALTAMFVLTTFTAAQGPQEPALSPRPAPKSPSDSHLYRNSTFGFRYQIPYGWVDRTKEMNDQESDDQPNPAAESPQGQLQGQLQNQVLLAIFERPPDAPGSTINSAVLIASESVASYPGLKKAGDYLDPLTELTSAKGFTPDGDPEDITIDSRQLIRADFSKILRPAADSADSAAKDLANDSATDPAEAPAKAPSQDTAPSQNKDSSQDKNSSQSKAQLTMHQSTLILLTRGQILSFTFIAGSDDEIDDLIEGLHFGAATTPPPNPKK